MTNEEYSPTVRRVMATFNRELKLRKMREILAHYVTANGYCRVCAGTGDHATLPHKCRFCGGTGRHNAEGLELMEGER